MNIRIVPSPTEPTDRTAADAAQMLRNRIVLRTGNSQDAHGRAFTPYTRTYGKAKRAALYVVGGAR